MNKGIIGNNKGRRKPLDLTGKILADAQSYKPSLETKSQNTKGPSIIQPSGDLTLIDDKKQYHEIIKYIESTFPNFGNKLSDKLSFCVDTVIGSNSFSVVAIDMYLKSINSECRIATQVDMENYYPSTKVDSGLVLRNRNVHTGRNSTHLYSQIAQRSEKVEKAFERGVPIWINLKDLILDDQGLFNLTDESVFGNEECLNWLNKTSFSKTNYLGLPIEWDEGSDWAIVNTPFLNNALHRATLEGPILNTSSLDLYSGHGQIVLAKHRNKK